MDDDYVFTSDIKIEPVQQIGGDHLVVAALRVLPERSSVERLIKDLSVDDLLGTINYLIRHRHGTPFEHAMLTISCHAPLFVWRQWHRHRIGFSFNEQSERYGPIRPIFWVPRRDRPIIVPEGFKPSRPTFAQNQA